MQVLITNTLFQSHETSIFITMGVYFNLLQLVFITARETCSHGNGKCQQQHAMQNTRKNVIKPQKHKWYPRTPKVAAMLDRNFMFHLYSVIYGASVFGTRCYFSHRSFIIWHKHFYSLPMIKKNIFIFLCSSIWFNQNIHGKWVIRQTSEVSPKAMK